MKKTLALVLALALVFSTVTVAFAEEPATVGTDAKVCTDLGMLVGDGSGVTPAYLTTNPTRIQAAVMVLRLRGLEAEAKAFTGEGNFADADKAAWAKPIMGYLKAHPELGWQGDGTNFNPTANITAKEYYKAMLETLGYKQNTATVVGDFTWENVVEFATGKGLTNAAATTFTVNDLAVATVQALKASVKDGGKTLVATLVEAGKVNKDAAVAAGVYTEAATTSAVALKAVKAIGNTSVEVEYTADVEKAFAENAANYNVVEKDTTTALEVKSALIDGTKKAVLTTAAMTAGKTYTMTVGDVKINFGGKAKITGAPELDKAEGTDTETVELTFTKVMDLETATNVANYTIAGVTVEKAELDSARKVVTLTTKGLSAGKSYTVKVTNVKSVDGVVLKSASKSFYSKSDKIAPKVNKVTVNTFKRITLEYNELVTEESAEDIANYTIKAGSTELEIEKIVDVTGSDDDYTTVEITTAAQKAGTRYEVAVLNVVDQSVLANKITRASKISFSGKTEDKSAPVFESFSYNARNMVVVTFKDGSRLDKDSALNIENYSLNNDITIEKVELLPGADDDFNKVLLTTSEFGAKSSYELKISGIRDEYGNEMKEKKSTKGYIKADAIKSTQVSKAYATKTTEVKIDFTKEVNALTAKDVANYSIDNEVGTPLTAKVDSDANTVTLTVPELTAGKAYTITINGVADLAGNVLVGIKPSFTGLSDENDLDAPEIDEITAVNKDVVKVRFDEAIKIPTTLSTITMTIEPVGSTTTTTLVAKVAYEDNTVIEFSKSGYDYATSSTHLNLGDVEWEVTAVANFKDKASNGYKVDAANKPTFYGTSEAAEPVEFSWEQVNVNKFKLIFDEPVDHIGSAQFAGLSAWHDNDNDENDYTVWYLTSSAPIKVDKEFKDDMTTVFQNYHSVPVVNVDSDDETILLASLEDEDAPFVEKVEAQYRDRIVITYSEELKTGSLGTYSVSYYDDKGKEKFITPVTPAFYSATAHNKVKIDLGTVLDSAITYTLKVTGGAYDLAGNRGEKDEEYSFMGSDLQRVGTYIKGVEVVNGASIIVYATAWGSYNVDVDGSGGITSDEENVGEDVDVSTEVNNTDVNLISAVDVLDEGTVAFATYTIGSETVPLAAFAKGTTYKVTVGSMTKEFDGIVDSGVRVVKGTTTGTFDISYSDMQGDDIIVVVGDKLDELSVKNQAYKLAQDVDGSGNPVVDADDNPVYSDVNNGYWNTTINTATTPKVDVLVVRDGQVILYETGVDLTSL